MNSQNNKGPGVFDMINTYADQHNISNDDIFKSDNVEKKEVIKPIRKETPKKASDTTTEPNAAWTPSEEDLAGMDEMKRTTGIVYKKDDWKDKIDPAELKNIVEDKVAQDALDQMDELQRAGFNIEASKRRLGIKYLNIPTIFNSRIMDAASDTNYSRAAHNLDMLINAITEQFPDAIVERFPVEVVNESTSVNNTQTNDTMTTEVEDSVVQNPVDTTDITPAVETPITNTATLSNNQNFSIDETKVIIDKTKASEISFSNEDIDKIKKSRSVTLNIVETKNIEYSIIEEDNADGKMSSIDTILHQYTRKMNDMRVSMPASKYRCTFTGLSYPEMLDLSYSTELNNLDGERKKWAIVFNHIKNPSIGEFREYEYMNEKDQPVKVTAFEDFLKKTSFIDLEFSLWAILCATCLEKEIVSIDCHSENCKNTYDWIYDPRALIQMDSVPEVTLSDMKVTGELETVEEIAKHYNESMLRLQNTVKLPSSGFVVCFGHISAYDYLEGRLSDVISIRESQDTSLSTVFEASGLTVIKFLLLPDLNSDKYRKISNGLDIMKVIHTLDELDCKVIGELLSLMVDPYQFKFSLKDLVCPKCRTRSNIDIDDVSRLLFLIAQSLSNSEVKLIRS